MYTSGHCGYEMSDKFQMKLAFLVVSLAILGVESQYVRRRIKKIIPSNQENYVYRHHQQTKLAQEHRGRKNLNILFYSKLYI